MTLRDEIDALFRPVVPSFVAHDFQIKVAQCLLDGKNVILQAPTGAGKTEAALAPFLVARCRNSNDFPLKMMLATPLRTLAKDLHRRACDVAGALGSTCLALDVKLHTGEDTNDDLFEADLIVTTIDQLMSGYAHIPLSLPPRLANINAGAVIASYIVFDECHLHDPTRAFRTALLMAKELKGIAPFLFMTATLSHEMVEELATLLDAEVVRTDSTALQIIPSQQKVRTFERHEEALSAASVAQHHQNRSLVVCNTVAKAQGIFDELKVLQSEGELQETHLELIHSKFFPRDRNAKETRLQELMGKGSARDAILVATQVIEVGIDISCEHLHTELCPANSLLQRVGRCARYTGEVGTVHVYDSLNKNGERSYRPYTYGETPEETVTGWFDRTWNALPSLNGMNVGFDGEKALIDAVHTESDLDNLSAYTSDPQHHSAYLRDARSGEKRSEARSLARQLIRDIDAVAVIVHPDPEVLSTWKEVRRLEQLNLYPYELTGLLSRAGKDWSVKVAYFPDDWDFESEGRPPLYWRVPDSAKKIFSGLAICLNPACLTYSAERGLRLEPEGEVFESPAKKATEGGWEPHWYTFETYEQHIERVMRAAYREVPEVFHVAPKVDAALDLPPGLTEALVRAAIAAHDFGKLSSGWQTWSRRWQDQQCETYKGGLWAGELSRLRPTEQPDGVFSAHTDYHPNFDNEAQKDFIKTFGRRPGHALESAMLFEKFFAEYLRERFGTALGKQKLVDCLSAVTKAICKHHGADTKPYRGERGPYGWQLDQNAADELVHVFQRFSDWTVGEPRLDAGNVVFFRGFELMWDGPNSATRAHWLLYSLVVRALRLGDQKSFPRNIEELA
ncbi:CRISPR-associated helicase/endonuclease Cas3 [soil metagenome]